MLNIFIIFPQYLGKNIKDHRYTTRSVRFNPIFSFLYWHMEYHVEHHMFPSVPSYNLPRLSNLIKNQLPKANTSLYDAYKEIIPAIIRQHKDNSYYISKIVMDFKELISILKRLYREHLVRYLNRIFFSLFLSLIVPPS